MAVSKTPKECLADLTAKEIIFNDYKKNWEDWDKEITAEKQKRTDTTTDINTKDNILHAYMVEQFTNNQRWKRIGNCTLDNTCKQACEIAYSDLYTTTPMGKGFDWFNRNYGEDKRFKVASSLKLSNP